jgi:protein O-GlcNAc transferase
MASIQVKSNSPVPHRLDVQSPSLSAGWQFFSRGHLKKATDVCRSVLTSVPRCGEAWHLLGLLAHAQGDPCRAVAHLKQAIAVAPLQPGLYNNLGFILNSMGRYNRAQSCFTTALEIDPGFHDARCNLGLSFYHRNLFRRAAKCFDQILYAVPDHAAALANLGMTRLAQQRYAEAMDAYEKAVALCPDQAAWHGNLGAAGIGMGHYDQAARSFHRASQLNTAMPEYHIHRSIALRAAGNLPESIRLLEAALTKYPGRSSAVAHLVVGLEYTCQWEKLDLYHPLLDQATQDALDEGRRPDEDPMLNIRRCDDVAVNQAVGRAWSRYRQNRARRNATPLSHNRTGRQCRKIAIGYLSYDFRNHPVAHQLHPLFGLHDRNRFRTVAFSMGPDDGTPFRKQIASGCDDFVDIGALGMAEAAHTIHRHNIDILVDLMGHSHHNRMEILALRPAPIQVGYLGFLSTTGAPFIDYLVTDVTVVPKGHEPYFDEKLLRMPHCYQFNHAGLMNPTPHTRRQAWGLPDSGFVFCSFNTVYKIDRDLFDTWLRILKQVPGSVLWLNGGHQLARRHMRNRAQMLGIDPARLVFCEKIALEDHLGRIGLADLALDTIRYNGGATTANTIGAGVPVLTVMGRHWVSRMSASQLTAIGLPDLVFPSVAAYESAAIELALDAPALQSVRERLKKNLKDHPLFDSHGFVRRLEAGFENIWQRYLNGLGPDHVEIAHTRPGVAHG